MLFRIENVLIKNILHRVAFATILSFSPIVYPGPGVLYKKNLCKVNIPDNSVSVNSIVDLSDAPSGAIITNVNIHYEIRHSYIGNLKVWLTTFYDDAWHDFILKDREGGNADSIIETRENLTIWNGASTNQIWYLVVQDMATGDTGYVDSFEIWEMYFVDDPPSIPSSEDTNNGDMGISINPVLDWTCTDLNNDTLFQTVFFEQIDLSPNIAIKADQTSSYASPGMLDYNSHYYWQVMVDDHMGGVTLSPIWDFYTELRGNLIVTVQNTNGLPIQNARVVRYNSDGSTVSGRTNSNGEIAWYNLSTGNYSLEVYYKGPSFDEEYWGDGTATISTGETTSKTIDRIYPYTKSVTIWNDDTGDQLDPFNNIPMGTDVRVEIAIHNEVSQSLKTEVRLLMDTDMTEIYNFDQASIIKSIDSDCTENYTFFCTVNDSSTWFIALEVKTTLLNDNTVTTDVWPWQEAFQVDVSALPPITDGRIAWHSYLEYDDYSNDCSSLDGRILIYDFETNTYNTRAMSTIAAGVQHAMNPNFSKDGRYLTFMGLPTTRTYNPYQPWYRYLDIFVYDFRNDTLVNLSGLIGRDGYNQYEEDPVFSPDGQWVAFKYQRENIYKVSLSDYSLHQVTAGRGEESGPQYSPLDGNWITFWVGDGVDACIAKVPADSEFAINYILIVDNLLPGEIGIQDYFPIYWDTERLIYTSWCKIQPPGQNDDIRVRNLATQEDYYAVFNSNLVDDSDAFPITNGLIGFSKRVGQYELWYGNPISGDTAPLCIGDTGKDNLGGEYCSVAVAFVSN